MAEHDQIIKILKTLQAAYPNARTENPAEMVDLWIRKLARFNNQVLAKASDQVIDQSKWFPSIAEFLKAAEIAQEDYFAEYQRQSARRIELEERYWLRGQFDREEWEALAREMEAAGRIDGAMRLRAKAAIFAEECVDQPVQ